MVPLLSAAKVKGKNAFSLVDEKWVTEFFNPKVGKRGAEIIEARKLSSAASAGNSAIEHIRDWANGAKDWVSMAVHSDGSYGVPKGLVFSFPCEVKGDGKYSIV
jgi:malate/lactate dehydrogenase